MYSLTFSTLCWFALAQVQPQLDASPHHWWQDPITAFTAALAFAAFIQLFIYHRQAIYMRDGLAVTRIAADAAKKSADAAIKSVEQMQLERRAWLTVTFAIKRLEPGKPIMAAIQVLNSGKTPAIIRKYKLTAGWPQIPVSPVDYKRNLEIHLTESPWRSRENIIAPNSTYDFIVDDLPIPTKEQVDDVKNNVKELYFIVTLVYSDFEDGRETQCYLLYRADHDAVVQYDLYNHAR